MSTVTVQVKANDTKAWRGARGSSDMMSGLGALILTAAVEPGVVFRVEIEGSPDELVTLRDRLDAALRSEMW